MNIGLRKLTRRHVLGLGAVGAVVAAVSSRPLRHIWNARWGFAKSQRTTARDESEAGALTVAEQETLWRLFVAMREHWNLDDTVGRAEFNQIVALKVSVPPSYLAEYRRAVAVFEKLCASHAANIAVARLVAAHRERDDGQPTDEAHIQDWVLGEMVNLVLIRGAFASFGVPKYSGFVAGPAGYTRAS